MPGGGDAAPARRSTTSGTPVRHNEYVDLCRSGQATCVADFSGEVFTFGPELDLCPLISGGPTG